MKQNNLSADQANKFSWKKRAKSFVYAWQGIISFFRYEHNARIHLVASAIVLFIAWYFHLSTNEWTALIILISLVWITEIMNTAVEKMVDMIDPSWNAAVKIIKDLAAGAVLVAAAAAAVTGGIIFIPKILELWKN